ncbi:MAG: hypothetical protein KF784_13335 [Fimbriimonadaceae bacterium]|nr:hypothetical protein [Fimbriimonadaceae bacterium]
MQIVDYERLYNRAKGENQPAERVLEEFVQDTYTRLEALEGLVMEEGISLRAQSLLNELLTAASSIGAERVALVGRRVSIAFSDGQAERAAVLLTQLKWELETVRQQPGEAPDLAFSA